MPKTPIVEMRDIEKSFHGVKALNGLSMDLYPGEVHCLVGENGAGKSTLIKVLTGAHLPNRGTIIVDGVEYHLPVNNGPNSLHGGTEGFDSKVWTVDGVTAVWPKRLPKLVAGSRGPGLDVVRVAAYLRAVLPPAARS